MLKKRSFKVFAFVVALMFITMQSVLALDMNEIQTPTGFKALLTIVPLVLVLVLLFLKVDMVLAGIIAAVLAMLIGGLAFTELNKQVMAAIPSMLSNTVPIVNSAVAMAVFKAGSYTASLELVNRAVKGKLEYVAGFLVILVGAATYMSGIGGGTLMVVAPMAFVAVGAVPSLIAAMSIAAAVGFATSPASLESSVVANLGGYDVALHVATMRPYWLLFTAIAIVIAFIGVKRANIDAKAKSDARYAEMSSGTLARYTIPAIFLLSAVIFGPFINKAIGFALITPVVYMVVTLLLVFVCTDTDINKSFGAIVDGSSYILTRLFQVGIFLGFINVIALTGTFGVIAGVARLVPEFIVVSVAVLTGVLIGIPAGAYVGSILGLVLPVGIALGFSPLALGFVTMGVAFGSQMSFVNIGMQAQSSGFQIPILQVVKGNLKYLWGVAIVLMVIALFMH